MKRDITYRVECDCGQSYTQTIPDIHQGDEDRCKPHVCGACGSRDIRVWLLLYDALGLAIKARLEGVKL